MFLQKEWNGSSVKSPAKKDVIVNFPLTNLHQGVVSKRNDFVALSLWISHKATEIVAGLELIGCCCCCTIIIVVMYVVVHHRRTRFSLNPICPHSVHRAIKVSPSERAVRPRNSVDGQTGRPFSLLFSKIGGQKWTLSQILL